jgi:hypothetical protein
LDITETIILIDSTIIVSNARDCPIMTLSFWGGVKDFVIKSVVGEDGVITSNLVTSFKINPFLI